MRHDVTTPVYRIMKAVDTLLASLSAPVAFEALLPVLDVLPYPTTPARGWIPLYTMVTFRPDVRYGDARRRAEGQYKTLRLAGWTTVIGAIGAAAAWSAGRILLAKQRRA